MPGVIAPHRGPLDSETVRVALALWAGPDAVLTGSWALSALGVRTQPPRHATFLLAQGGYVRRHDRARLVRTRRLPRVVRTQGVLRIASPARALVDTSVFERHTMQELEHLAIGILQRGLASPEQLAQEMRGRPIASVGPVKRGLEAFRQGAWSRPEAVLRELIGGRHGFPSMVTNRRLVSVATETFIGCPDAYFEEAGVAVQVQSRQYHQGFDDQGGDQWARTVEKDSAYVAVGVRVLGVTPWTLYRNPDTFLSRLRQTIELGVAGPRPAVRVD